MRGQQRFRATLAAAPLDERDPYRGFTYPITVHKYSFGPAVQESAKRGQNA